MNFKIPTFNIGCLNTAATAVGNFAQGLYNAAKARWSDTAPISPDQALQQLGAITETDGGAPLGYFSPEHEAMIAAAKAPKAKEFSQEALQAQAEDGLIPVRDEEDIPEIMTQLQSIEDRLASDSFDPNKIVDDFISLDADQRKFYFDGPALKQQLARRFATVLPQIVRTLGEKGDILYQSRQWQESYETNVAYVRIAYHFAKTFFDPNMLVQMEFYPALTKAAFSLMNVRIRNEGLFALGADANLADLRGKIVFDARNIDAYYQIVGQGSGGSIKLTPTTTGNKNTVEISPVFLRLWDAHQTAIVVDAIKREILDSFVPRNAAGEYLFHDNVIRFVNMRPRQEMPEG